MSKTLTVILLVAVLMSIIFGTGYIAKSVIVNASEKLEHSLSRLETEILSENWVEAEKLLSIVENDWDKTSKKWAMLIDHQEIDNVNNSLSKMIRYVKLKEKSHALAETSTVIQFIKHIPDEIAFSIENIF